MKRDAESTSLLLWLKWFDESDRQATSWEVGFIKRVLRGTYGGPLSEKQKEVIYTMQEKYKGSE